MPNFIAVNMHVARTSAQLKDILDDWRSEGQSIHFVPTMGALHKGHISLVKNGLGRDCKMVVSVFVNPTQFNDPQDLEKYPRTYQADHDLLIENACDLMFYPTAEEIYRSSVTLEYDLDGLDDQMEGRFRPGHFNGVVEVVDKLFALVSPDKAYFGQKDFQQLAIIRHMMQKLGHRTEVIGCPTIREKSGLAMSSRNTLLSKDGRERASIIHSTLLNAKSLYLEGNDVSSILDASKRQLSDSNLELEYLEIVNPESLDPILNNTGEPAVACIAAYLEGVRLIDNLRLNA